MIRFATDTTLALCASREDQAQRSRDKRVRPVIHGPVADLAAIQELPAPGPLAELALVVDMTAHHQPPGHRAGNDAGDAGDGTPALGESPHGYHVGLLGHPNTVRPVRHTSHRYGEGDFHHNLIKGVFEVDGEDGQTSRVQHANFHATPFGACAARADEYGRVVTYDPAAIDIPPLQAA